MMEASATSSNRAALLAIASRTDSISVGELAMTRRTSEVALCCSSASFSLCSSSAILSAALMAGRLRPSFAALRRFNVLGRCGLTALSPVLSGRLIASPEVREKPSYQPAGVLRKGLHETNPCPLWVINGHLHCNKPCRLTPESGHPTDFYKPSTMNARDFVALILMAVISFVF